jgi:hypothetical protein
MAVENIQISRQKFKNCKDYYGGKLREFRHSNPCNFLIFLAGNLNIFNCHEFLKNQGSLERKISGNLGKSGILLALLYIQYFSLKTEISRVLWGLQISTIINGQPPHDPPKKNPPINTKFYGK